MFRFQSVIHRVIFFLFTGVFGFLFFVSPAYAEQGTWTIDGSGVITGLSTTTAFSGATGYYFLSATNVNPYQICSGGQSGSGTFTPSDFIGGNVFTNGGLNTSGSGTDCRPAGDYYFVLAPNGSSPPTSFYQLHWDGSSVDPVNPTNCVGGVSCISAVDPPADFPKNWPLARATSTSFAFGVSGHVSTDDFQTGDYVFLQAFNNAQNSSIAAVSLFATPAFNSDRVVETFNFPINSSGDFSFATTTSITQIGVYTLQAQIRHKDSLWNGIFDFFNFAPQTTSSNSYVATTTAFLVATTTVYDALEGNSSNSLHDAYLQAVAANQCTNWLDPTQLSSCITSLFIPSQSQSDQVVSLFQSAILQRAPVGYITRFATIVGSSTPVEPIGISYTFGSSSPAVLNGETYTINIFSPSYLGTSSPLYRARADDGTNKNIWDIIDPYFTTVVALAVLLVILSDLMGIELQHDGTQLTTESSGRMSVIESARVARSAKRSMKHPTGGRDSVGRDAASRRRDINQRGRDYDRGGGRGVIH